VKLTLACAVRLTRANLDCLDSLHRRQCALAIGPATIEDGSADVGPAGGDVFGLVYVRFAVENDPVLAFEGWFLDRGRFPDEQAMPERGALFPTGTTAATGPRRWPAERFGARIPVEVAEPVAAAPPALEIALARRFTLDEVRAAEPLSRFQLLHGLRPSRAALYTMDSMESPDALGVLYRFVDLGPGTDIATLPPHLRAHKRSGLLYLRLRTLDSPQGAFEGWFWDKLRHPSVKAVPRDGRLFLAGSVIPAGVSLERTRVRIDPGRRLKDATGLAVGFARLAGKLRVTVSGRS